MLLVWVLLSIIEIVVIVLILVFWFHIRHLLILLVLLLNVLNVILNFGHWLLRLAVHLLLDHSVYLLLLWIAEDTVLSLVLSHHSVLILWNSHFLHRPSLRACNLPCLLAAAVLIELVPQREQHPFNGFWYHFDAVFHVFGRGLHAQLGKHFVIKSRPIVRLLLHGMGVRVIMQVHQLRVEVLHHFCYQDYK
jgi:hypothetical protein